MTTRGASMDHETLYIVTAVSNPLRWRSRTNLAQAAILSWLGEPNVNVTIVECAYGDRPYELDWMADEQFTHRHVTHVPVRANTPVWSKENLLNLGVYRLPQAARWIGIFDADVHFRTPGWASEIIHELQLFPVIQPWTSCLDLGPNNEHMQVHTSFCSLYQTGQPALKHKHPMWKGEGGMYEYAHPGFAWAFTRKALNDVGGLFELSGMGSGDYHMATAMIGEVNHSIVKQTSPVYRQALHEWQESAARAINRKIGALGLTIEHSWHGPKSARGYISRWDMFEKHGFDPLTDLRRNSYGVLEWNGNKPELEREWLNYLRCRNEDVNSK